MPLVKRQTHSHPHKPRKRLKFLTRKLTPIHQKKKQKNALAKRKRKKKKERRRRKTKNKRNAHIRRLSRRRARRVGRKRKRESGRRITRRITRKIIRRKISNTRNNTRKITGLNKIKNCDSLSNQKYASISSTTAFLFSFHIYPFIYL